MIIDCISDLHGHYPELEGGDLLIIAGDLTARHTEEDWLSFENWICRQSYKEKIITAGNHDNFLASMDEHRMWKYWEKVGVTYLCDSGTEFEGLKIYGSPWTYRFQGINSKCAAFTLDYEELEKKMESIPYNDIDILVTHCPPFGILDSIFSKPVWEHTASRALRNNIWNKPNHIQLHVFGHIHEHGGKIFDTGGTIFVNASIMNERYEPVNKPVRIEL